MGPYLSERQWATVREDYSPDGAVWESFRTTTLAHTLTAGAKTVWQARRGGGRLARMSGGRQLQRAMFGLTGNEGNHGEDARRTLVRGRLPQP